MNINRFKIRFFLFLTSAAILITSRAGAQTYDGVFNYNTTDVLLVFSANGYDNIYFDLGPVTQFENHTNGYQVQVTNWNPNVVATYLGGFPANGGSLTINFNLGAGDPDTTYDAWATYTANETLSSAYELGNTIDANGWSLNNLSQDGIEDMQNPQAGDFFATNYVVLVPAQKVAWDWKDNDNQWGVGISGGLFYTSVPGSIPFYQFAANATTQLGTFQFTADGRLFFTVGSILDRNVKITNFAYDGVTEADVTFNTIIGSNYQLLESTNVALPLSSWKVVTDAVVDYPETGGTGTGSVQGDGNPHTLSDLNATNSPNFYLIESY